MSFRGSWGTLGGAWGGTPARLAQLTGAPTWQRVRSHGSSLLSADEFQKLFNEFDKRATKEVTGRREPHPGPGPPGEWAVCGVRAVTTGDSVTSACTGRPGLRPWGWCPGKGTVAGGSWGSTSRSLQKSLLLGFLVSATELSPPRAPLPRGVSVCLKPRSRVPTLVWGPRGASPSSSGLCPDAPLPAC